MTILDKFPKQVIRPLYPDGMIQRYRVLNGSIGAGDYVKFSYNNVELDLDKEIFVELADNPYNAEGVAIEFKSGYNTDPLLNPYIAINVKNDNILTIGDGIYNGTAGDTIKVGDFIIYTGDDINGYTFTKASKVIDSNGFVQQDGVVGDTITIYSKPSSVNHMINQIITGYKVSSRESINAGDFVKYINNEYVRTDEVPILSSNTKIFNDGIFNAIKSVKIANDKVLVCYTDGGNSNCGTSELLTINNNNIVSECRHVFNTFDINPIDITTIADNKVLVCYRDKGNSNYGTSQILTINNNIITSGYKYVFRTTNARYISSLLLSDNKVLICHSDSTNSYEGVAQILTINNDIMTASESLCIFNGATNTLFITTTQIADNKVLVCYRDGGNSNYGTSQILTINNDIVTFGSKYVFKTSSVYTIYTTQIADNKVLVCYRDGGNSNYGTSQILTINNDIVTFGSVYVFNDSDTYLTSVKYMTNNKILVTYKLGSYSNYGASQILDINSLDVVQSEIMYIYEKSVTDYYGTSLILSENKALVFYNDITNNKGKVSLLTLYNNKSGTVSGNTEYDFSMDNSVDAYDTRAVRLSDTKALLVFSDGGNNGYGTAVVVTLTGYTINTGTAVVFAAYAIYYGIPILVKTTATEYDVLLVYSNSSDGNKGYIQTISIDAETSIITAGTGTLFNNKNTTAISATLISNYNVLLSYSTYDESNNYLGYCRLVNINSSTGAYTFNNAKKIDDTISIRNAVVASISNNKALMTYTDYTGTDSGKGKAIILNKISDTITTTISDGSEDYTFSDNTALIDLIRLSDTKLLVTYKDTNNNLYPTAKVLTINNSGDQTIITNNQTYVIDSVSSMYIKSVAMNESTVLMIYSYEYTVGVKLLSISGGIIYQTQDLDLYGSVTYNRGLGIVKVSDKSAVVLFRDRDPRFIRNNTGQIFGAASIITLSSNNNTISNSSTIPFTPYFNYMVDENDEERPTYERVYNRSEGVNYVLLSENKILVVYDNSDDGTHSNISVLTVETNTLSSSMINWSVTNAVTPALYSQSSSLVENSIMLSLSDTIRSVIYTHEGTLEIGNFYAADVIANPTSNILSTPPVRISYKTIDTDVSKYTAVQISNNKILISYIKNDNSNITKIITTRTSDMFSSIIDISEVYNVEIPAGAIAIKSSRVTDSLAAISYITNNNVAKTTLLDIASYINDGSGINISTPTIFNNNTPLYQMVIDSIIENKVLLGYVTSYRGYAQILSITNDIITPGIIVNIDDSINIKSCTKITDNKALIIYADTTNSHKGNVKLLDIVDNTISPISASEIIFNDRYTTMAYPVLLSENNILISYNNISRLLTLSGDTISLHDERMIDYNNTSAYEIKLIKVSDTRALVFYIDINNYSWYNIQVLTINNDNSIDFDDNRAYNPIGRNNIIVERVSDNKVLMCYRTGTDHTYYGTACILTINDNNAIIESDEYTFNDDSSIIYRIVMLNENKALIFYSVHTRILTINNDNSIVAGDPKILSDMNITLASHVLLSENKILASYIDSYNSNYGAIKILTINNDDSTSLSDKYIFNSNGTEYISPVKLSDNKVLLCYRNSGNSYYGTAKIAYISETGIVTFGSEFVFNSSDTRYIKAVLLSDNIVSVSYNDFGNSQYGTSQVLIVNGINDTINSGNNYIFNTHITEDIDSILISNNKILNCYKDMGRVNYNSMQLLDNDITNNYNAITGYSEYLYDNERIIDMSSIKLPNNKVLVCFNRIRGNYNEGISQILTVNDDNSIILNSECIFNEGLSNNISLVSLNDTKALVCYRDHNNEGKGTTRILNINTDNTITLEDEVIFNVNDTRYTSATRLSSNRVLVCWYDDSINGKARVLIVNNDNTIILGTEIIFNDNYVYYITSTLVLNNKVLVCYRDGGNSNYSTARVLTINNDNTITLGAEVVFNDSDTYTYSSTLISDNKVLVCYTDTSNSDYGTARVLTINNNGNITLGSEFIFTESSICAIHASLIINNKALICYSDNSNYGVSQILTIDNDVINFGYKYILNIQDHTEFSNNASKSIIQIDNGRFLIFMYNYISIIQIKDNVISNGFIKYVDIYENMVYKSLNINEIMGIANTSGNSSDIIDIVTPHAHLNLDDLTWDQISAISASGRASEYFNIGDTKAVHIQGTIGTIDVDETYYVYIIGFDHNSEIEGNGISFGTFKTAKTDGIDIALTDYGYRKEFMDGSKYFNMNHDGIGNVGGWQGCDLRYDILGSVDVNNAQNASTTTATSPVPNTLMAAFPADLRAVMKPITKYTDNYGNANNDPTKVTSTIDYLPLLSEYELFGVIEYSNRGESNYQQQYEYYRVGNSISKFNNNAISLVAHASERSVNNTTSYMFCYGYMRAYSNNSDAKISNAITAIFLV